MGDWMTGTRKGHGGMGRGSCGSGTGCDVGGGRGMVILHRKFVYAMDVEDTSEEESSEDRYGSSLLCWQPLSPSLDDGGVGGDTGGLPR